MYPGNLKVQPVTKLALFTKHIVMFLLNILYRCSNIASASGYSPGQSTWGL